MIHLPEGEGPPDDAGQLPRGTPPVPEQTARQKGDRFRKEDDARQQLSEIEAAQQKIRQGKSKQIIDSMEKSKQRLKNKFKQIRRQEDLEP
jgi:hypothetical protein